MNKWFLLVNIVMLLSINIKAQTPYEATWQSLEKYKCPEWFCDAKFGIFIHWGVYSVPAHGNEWYPHEMYRKDSKVYKYHVEKYGTPDKFGYKDFIPMFTAEKFNADEWLDIFKKSGARYIVPVAEHHDGFAMYKTSLSRWNAYEMGPKRDIIGELAEATRKQDLVFGVSSHRIEHWWFLNPAKSYLTDVLDPKLADFYGPARQQSETMSPEFMNDWLMRNIELVEKYQPQLFWFDWWIEQPALEPYRKSFASYYYNRALEWDKGVVINYKNEAFPERAAVYDIERGSSKESKKLPWQTDTSIGKKSWGYIEGEQNKSVNELVDLLIDIVSKNGNLLLNIGPKADGTITDEQKEVLLGMGKWLGINGEGIYNSRPWKVSGEGPTEIVGEKVMFNEYKQKGFTANDIRFTAKGDSIYAFVLGIPGTKITIKSLPLESEGLSVKSVKLLGSEELVKWEQKKDGLVIQPSKEYPSDVAVAFRIVVKEEDQETGN